MPEPRLQSHAGSAAVREDRCHGGRRAPVDQAAGHSAGAGPAGHAHCASRDRARARPPEAPPDSVPGQHAVDLRDDQSGQSSLPSHWVTRRVSTLGMRRECSFISWRRH